MEETNTPVLEEEILSQEITTDQEEITPEAKSYTEEEVEEIKKKMQSDSDKWVQKILKETRLAQTALDEIAKVAQNNEHLVDIFETKPEVAPTLPPQYRGTPLPNHIVDTNKMILPGTEKPTKPAPVQDNVPRGVLPEVPVASKMETTSILPAS